MSGPLFSIVVPVYNPPHDAFRDMVASVLAQSYTRWELLLIDDASPDPMVSELLAEAAADRRVRVLRRQENGGIVRASNDGVAEAAGEFIALLDHDDMLTADALERMAEAIADAPDADYLYSDEDKVDDDGVFSQRFDKPDWSPERLRGQMYTGHLSVLRAAVVREVGGFHEGFDGSQDHDLALRVTERARRVVHVPEVLYHWRIVPGSTAGSIDNKSYAQEAGVRAVQEHLDRMGIRATAEQGPVPGTYAVLREPELERSVSVIIPTRGTSGTVFGEERVFVVEAVRSLLAKTAHRDIEIVVVYDVGTPDAVLDELREIAGDRLTAVEFEGVFNFSRKCNVGVLASRGEVLLFLNDDVQVLSDEMVGQLVAPLAEPDVGMTGAMLLFEDGTIQHAGHAHHMGMFSHYYLAEPADAYGAFSSLLVNREASGLTAACIAVPREVFFEVGGFSEQLPGNFNDVDFSIKIRNAGFRLVWLRDVRLFHFESKTRSPLVHSFEEQIIIGRWGGPARDPYLA